MKSLPGNLHQLSIEMSDRHLGVGGDGIIIILPSDSADFKMRIFNADGSEAMMCGNGIRCVAKYVFDKGLTDKTHLDIDTLSGIKHIDLLIENGVAVGASVDMGAPVLTAPEIPIISNSPEFINQKVSTSYGDVEITAVSMGNPHGVVFVDDLSMINVHGLGRELEIHPMWPNRANIEFVEVLSPGEVRMRVWERGSGETMACGTGACAVAVAGARTGRTDRKVKVHLLGGDLDIEWTTDGPVRMSGPAAMAFEGEYEWIEH